MLFKSSLIYSSLTNDSSVKGRLSKPSHIPWNSSFCLSNTFPVLNFVFFNCKAFLQLPISVSTYFTEMRECRACSHKLLMCQHHLLPFRISLSRFIWPFILWQVILANGNFGTRSFSAHIFFFIVSSRSSSSSEHNTYMYLDKVDTNIQQAALLQEYSMLYEHHTQVSAPCIDCYN
jgi:hypothetical protein